MPATKTEITDKYDFKGDPLDRTFNVYHNPKTGEYAYDYAEITPVIATALDSIKYYRISSPKLSEVEQELAKHVKLEGPKPPRVKGEITKAAEEQVQKLEEAINVSESIEKKRQQGLPISQEEQQAQNKAVEEVTKLSRQKKINNAQTKFYKFETLLNEGKTLTQDEKNQQNSAKRIINAYEKIETLEEKAKTTPLTPAEQTEKTAAETLLNTQVPYVEPESKVNISEYNEKRGLVSSIEAIPEGQRTAKQMKNLANAKQFITTFEQSHPEEARKTANIRGKAASGPLQLRLNRLRGLINDKNTPNITGFENAPPPTKGGKRKTKKVKKSKKRRHTKKH